MGTGAGSIKRYRRMSYPPEHEHERALKFGYTKMRCQVYKYKYARVVSSMASPWSSTSTTQAQRPRTAHARETPQSTCTFEKSCETTSTSTRTYEYSNEGAPTAGPTQDYEYLCTC